MHTQTHLLIGAAALGRPGRAGMGLAAGFGSVLPDIPAIVMAGWALLVQRRDADEVFRVAYFSDAWHAVLAPAHSVPLWALVLAGGFALGRDVVKAFAGGGLLHMAFDLPVHADDPHRHFWPLSDWRFESPVSYWDPAHFGLWVAPLEVAAGLALVVLLWRRWSSRWARAGLLLLGVLYVAQGAGIAWWSLR